MTNQTESTAEMGEHISRLIKLARNAASSLTSYISNEYVGHDIYPSQARKWERDMTEVTELLSAIHAVEKPHELDSFIDGDDESILEKNIKMEKRHVPSRMLEYCPVCKRDMAPEERLFDLNNDNHIDRCIKPKTESTSPIHPTAEPVEDMGEFEKVRHALRVACVKAKDTTTVEQTYVPALKALDELQARARLNTQGWLPIDDNAKSGDGVMLWWPHYSTEPTIGAWIDEQWIGENPEWSCEGEESQSPTHYRPLPSPPSARLTQAGEA